MVLYSITELTNAQESDVTGIETVPRAQCRASMSRQPNSIYKQPSFGYAKCCVHKRLRRGIRPADPCLPPLHTEQWECMYYLKHMLCNNRVYRCVTGKGTSGHQSIADTLLHSYNNIATVTAVASSPPNQITGNLRKVEPLPDPTY